MTDELLGLPLEQALRILAEAGIEPEIHMTAAPRGREEGIIRVVRVRQNGREVTCARFLDPLASPQSDAE